MRNDHGMFRYAFPMTASAVADASKAAFFFFDATTAAALAAAVAVTAAHLDGARR
ncbi:hypothetical protein ABZ370_23505 [Streptomyces sp. NPDC005962]|uniref:hypothetical protein n=1 Tax=Streptomyces sp. NPDC005962 TaxID=3154466 RepID=UPI0033C8128C